MTSKISNLFHNYNFYLFFFSKYKFYNISQRLYWEKDKMDITLITTVDPVKEFCIYQLFTLLFSLFLR
jgi:hypothetical protein